MFRCLTLVIFTDLLMVAVFDAADDELVAEVEGTETTPACKLVESKSALLRDWQSIHDNPAARSKQRQKILEEAREAEEREEATGDSPKPKPPEDVFQPEKKHPGWKEEEGFKIGSPKKP